jgi:hypothetical protein
MWTRIGRTIIGWSSNDMMKVKYVRKGQSVVARKTNWVVSGGFWRLLFYWLCFLLECSSAALWHSEEVRHIPRLWWYWDRVETRARTPGSSRRVDRHRLEALIRNHLEEILLIVSNMTISIIVWGVRNILLQYYLWPYSTMWSRLEGFRQTWLCTIWKVFHLEVLECSASSKS